MSNTVIIGYGFVGRATEYLLARNQQPDPIVYDPKLGLSSTENWIDVEYAFICVPTPESDTGELDLSAVQEAYTLCTQFDITPVIRSTLGPDQVAQFPLAVVMPEFLREAHWQMDTENINTVLLGGDPDLVSGVAKLFPARNCEPMTAVDAMMYKLSRNALLAVKVTLANQLKQACDTVGADYNSVVHLLNTDNTLGQTHWDVPGPDGLFGYGGKCFPKDIAHMSKLCGAHNTFSHTQKINSKLRNSK